MARVQEAQEQLTLVRSVPAAELETKMYWVRKFRQAKSESTLDVMVQGALRKNNEVRVQASIYLAECHRLDELETGRYKS